MHVNKAHARPEGSYASSAGARAGGTYILDTSPRQFALDMLDCMIPRGADYDQRHQERPQRYYDLVSERTTVDDVEQRPHPFLAILGTLVMLSALGIAITQ